MNPNSSFVISQFTNPSGDVVFRVSGWLDGKRIRKNFPTRPEAEAERQVLEVQRLQGETGIRTAVTRLVDDQLHEAESVFRRLDGRPHSLSFYEYSNNRNQELKSWVEEHPEVKTKIEERLRNVPAANRERAFINAAKTEAMNQTVRHNGIRV